MHIVEFIGLAARSGLYTFDELQNKISRVPAEIRGDVDRIAHWLVGEGWLTEFQARRLLSGSPRRMVVGDYEVRDFLGRGGMGAVYLAKRRKTGEICALKVLPAEKRGKSRQLRRFQREMEVAQRLSHPGISAGLEAGVADELPYLAIEYVPGPTLYRLVRRMSPLPVYWCAYWLMQICEALDYAHQHGVIHRDLKPSNIIITPTGTAKLLDLGLARWYDDDHNEDEVVGIKRIVGSFDYIAPEQTVQSSTADGRSDIYGLGCVLYFALTGRAPFQDVEPRRAKIEHHRSRAPIPLTGLRPDVPPKMVRIVERMMSKEPDDRYQVAAQAADALRGFLPTVPAVAMPDVLASGVDKPDDQEVISSDEPIMLVEPEPWEASSTQFDDREITADVPLVTTESLWQRLRTSFADMFRLGGKKTNSQG